MHADICMHVCVCVLHEAVGFWCSRFADVELNPKPHPPLQRPWTGELQAAGVCLHSLRYLVHWFPLLVGFYIYQNWSGMRCEWKEFLQLIALPLKGEKHWLSKFKFTQAASTRRTLANCCRFSSVRFVSVRSMESMSMSAQSPPGTHTDWMSEGISYARQSKVCASR